MEQENLKLNLPLDEVIKMKEKSKSRTENHSEKFKKVFVGNLNFSTNWQKLKDYMKKAGNVLFADVFLDQKGRSKGCGLVEFSEHEEALKAIKTLNDTKLDGRYIYIREDNLSFVKSSKGFDEKRRSREKSKERSRSRSKSRSNSRKKHKDHKHKKKDHKKAEKPLKKTHKSRSRSRSKSIKSKSKKSNRSRSKTKEKEKEKSKSLSPLKSDNNRKNENNYNNNKTEIKNEEAHTNNDDKNADKNNKRKTSVSLDEKEKGYQIEVKNIPSNMSWQNLKDAFKYFGTIISADIENNNNYEKTGVVGYVTFEKKKDALNAIDDMHRATLNGQVISVKMFKR